MFAAGEMIKLGRTRHGVGQGILGMIHSPKPPAEVFLMGKKAKID